MGIRESRNQLIKLKAYNLIVTVNITINDKNCFKIILIIS